MLASVAAHVKAAPAYAIASGTMGIVVPAAVTDIDEPTWVIGELTAATTGRAVHLDELFVQ